MNQLINQLLGQLISQLINQLINRLTVIDPYETLGDHGHLGIPWDPPPGGLPGLRDSSCPSFCGDG